MVSKHGADGVGGWNWKTTTTPNLAVPGWTLKRRMVRRKGGRITKAGRYRKGCTQVAARFGTSPNPSAADALPRCCCSPRLRSQAQVGTERQRTRAKLGNEVGRRRQAVAAATASSSAPGGRHLDSAGEPVQALIKHIAADLAHHACAGRCGSRWSLGPSQWMRLGGVVRTLRPAAALTDATRT